MAKPTQDTPFLEAVRYFKQQEGALPLLLSLLLYTAAGVLWCFVPEYTLEVNDPAASILRAELWGGGILLALLALAPLCSMAFYLRGLLLPGLLQYLQGGQGAAGGGEGGAAPGLHPAHHLFYLALCGLNFMVLAYFCTTIGLPHFLWLAAEDLRLYERGEYALYEGPLRLAEEPAGPGGFYVVHDNYLCYFTGDVGALRYLAASYSGVQLLQPAYTVRYLPNTRTLVAITAQDGLERLGPNALRGEALEEGYWLYEDLPIRRCQEVYGYGQLSQAGQQMFDLLYGEYFSAGVRYGQEPTRAFTLPAPVGEEEYQRVMALYEANTFSQCYPTYRYTTDDVSTIEALYAGGKEYSGNYARNGYNRRLREKARRVVEGMPAGLTEAEKCLYLCGYLVKRVRYVEGGEEPAQDEAQRRAGITVLKSASAYETGYGALVEGRANCVGYAQAFDLLARLAGLTTLPVFGEVPGGKHAWNMVELEGEWYHVDVTWADNGEEADGAYLLADEAQFAADHRPVSYGGCAFVPLPRATGERYNWLRTHSQSYQSAEEALQALRAQPPGAQERLALRLPSGEEMARLAALFDAGEAPGLLLGLRQGFGAPLVGYVASAGYQPPPPPDYRALRAAVPYQGLATYEGGGPARLPRLGDETAQAFTLALGELLGGAQLDDGGFPAGRPSPGFASQVAMRHTRPVAWVPQAGGGTPYFPALAPIGDSVSPEAPAGVLQEHLEQSARLLFAGEFPLAHGDIAEENLAEDSHTEWAYDGRCGVYLHLPPGRPNRSYHDLVVLQYQESAAGIVLTAAQLHYCDYPALGPGGFVGYLFEGANEVVAPTDPTVAEYCRERAPRRRVELEKRPDGGLRLVSIGPVQR